MVTHFTTAAPKLEPARSRLPRPTERPSMTRFLRRLAITVAAASIPLAAVAVATSAVSSADCDPNWSRNVWTNECHPGTGATRLVRTPAGLRTAVRTRRRTAAASPAAMGAAACSRDGTKAASIGSGPGSERTSPSAASRFHSLRTPRKAFGERVAGCHATAKARLQGAQVEQDRVAQPVIAPLGELIDNFLGVPCRHAFFSSDRGTFDVCYSTASSSRICGMMSW